MLLIKQKILMVKKFIINYNLIILNLFLFLIEQKHISSSVKDGTTNIKSRANQLDTEYGISNRANATTKSIEDQWNQFDNQYGISRNTATAANSISETVGGWGNAIASGFSNSIQTPAVQNTLSSMSEWTNNVGRSIGTFLQPAVESVSREYNDIKNTTNREINERKREREEAKEGIQMEELGDLREESINNNPESSDNKPSPDTAKIPPPDSPTDEM